MTPNETDPVVRARVERDLGTLRVRVNKVGDVWMPQEDVEALLTALHTERQHTWRCFHCDEVFTDEAQAREHFGTEVLPYMGEGVYQPPPGCAIDIAQFRQLETDNHRLIVENSHFDNNARLWHEAEADRIRRIGNRQRWQALDSKEGERLALEEQVAALHTERETLRTALGIAMFNVPRCPVGGCTDNIHSGCTYCRVAVALAASQKEP